MAKQGRKMDDKQMQLRRETSLKTLYFNRFMLIRYSLAIFFFANFFVAYLCWPSATGIAGAALLIFSILPCWEMGKMYGQKAPGYKMTKLFFLLQWVFNLVLIFMLAMQPTSEVFPFLNDGNDAKITALVVLVIGFALASWCNFRFYQIDRNLDKTYRRIEFFESKYRLRFKS